MYILFSYMVYTADTGDKNEGPSHQSSQLRSLLKRLAQIVHPARQSQVCATHLSFSPNKSLLQQYQLVFKKYKNKTSALKLHDGNCRRCPRPLP